MWPHNCRLRAILAGLLAFAPAARASWLPNGNPVGAINGYQTTPRIAPDGAGGAFVCWGAASAGHSRHAGTDAAHEKRAQAGIAAVVNGEAILQSDVEELLYPILARAQQQPTSDQLNTLRCHVLEQLIDDKLIVAESQRQGVTVSDAEVNRAVDQAIQQKIQQLGGEQGFHDQLRRENTAEDWLREWYKKDVRRQMLVQRLLAKQFPPRTHFKDNYDAWIKGLRSKASIEYR